MSVEDAATTELVVAVASVEAAADNMTSAVLPAAVDATTTVVVAAVYAHMTSAVVPAAVEATTTFGVAAV